MMTDTTDNNNNNPDMTDNMTEETMEMGAATTEINQIETDSTEPKAEAQTILEAKEKLSQVLPTPEPQQMPVSSPQALKERLDWGEPALTILDARNRSEYLQEHITGAMLFSDFISRLSSVSPSRDMYVYGEDQASTDQAVEALHQVGFERVSQLKGGLSGWKAIAGPTEGRNP